MASALHDAVAEKAGRVLEDQKEKIVHLAPALVDASLRARPQTSSEQDEK